MQVDSKIVNLLAEDLIRRNWLCVTAESCTGGWIAQTLTSLAGSSAWFERGYVTYSNAAKCELLDLDADTLERYGAVSCETAAAMARGALKNSHAQVALSVTGIAGPDGGTPDKPVGTVAFGWVIKGSPADSEFQHFSGSRDEIRWRAVEHALRGLYTRLNG